MKPLPAEIDGILLAKRVKEQESAKGDLVVSENRPLIIGLYVLSSLVLAMALDYIGVPASERYIFSALILGVFGLVREVAIQRRQINALIKLIESNRTSGA